MLDRVVGDLSARWHRRSINKKFERLQRLGNHTGTPIDLDEAVLVERNGAIATLTINNPGSRNAINTATWRALAMRLEDLGKEEEIRGVILQGAGGHFSAGADVVEIARFAEALKDRPQRELQRVAYDYFDVARDTLRTIDDSPFVVIARMQGSALGIGNILALACDRRIADSSVRTGVPAGIIGIMLDPREMRRLVLHVGISNADKIIFSGDIYNEKDSLRMGQIDTLVESPEKLDEAVHEAANQAAKQSREAIITAKAGLGLIAKNPGFPDRAVTLAKHYLWAGPEAIARIQRRFERRRAAQ